MKESSSTTAVYIYILGIVLWASIVSERPIVKRRQKATIVPIRAAMIITPSRNMIVFDAAVDFL
jgi:hypothetical protein